VNPDEDLLRDHLRETAARADPPRFAADDLVRRVQRRRTRFLGAVTAVVGAAVIAVTVPLALSGGASQPAGNAPSRIPPGLSYVMTVNGQTQRFDSEGMQPSYLISPGENLVITIDATVPARLTVTAMWLGITDGVLASRPDGPASMSPILASYRDQLAGPAEHEFSLRWTVPKTLPAGTTRQLSVEWIWRGGPWDPGLAEGIIAILDVHLARRGDPADRLPPEREGQLWPIHSLLWL
jgi:hypothetical protein